MDRRVTHQSGLPHLPGVPHLHVNRPLIYSPLARRHEYKECTKAWYEIRSQAKRRGPEKAVVGHF